MLLNPNPIKGIDPVLEVFRDREITDAKEQREIAMIRVKNAGVYRTRDYLQLLPSLQAQPQTKMGFDKYGQPVEKTEMYYSFTFDISKMFSIYDRKRNREIQKLRALRRIEMLHGNIVEKILAKYRVKDQIEKLTKIRDSIRDTEKLFRVEDQIENLSGKVTQMELDIAEQKYFIENEVLICEE